ncbi:MAG: folylpolyglutamate synthase/dihydrofolate synthase family protein [Pirellulaceae bacterium]
MSQIAKPTSPENSIESGLLLNRLFGMINYERHPVADRSDLRVDAILQLLAKLGDPHLAIETIHVGGTKGKGSVSRLIADTLSRAGYRSACYTSPHMSRFNERFTISGNPVDDLTLNRALAAIFEIVDQSANSPWGERLTFFDLATATAFWIFRECRVEIAVIEVGLGGRRDSTNVCQPRLSVITNISLDHEKQLGSTLPEIAGEKAGIIKSTAPVITGVTQPDVVSVIENVASERSTTIWRLDKDFAIEHVRSLGAGYQFDIVCDHPLEDGKGQIDCAIKDIKLGLSGFHQTQNAALAIAALKFLSRNGYERLNDHVIRESTAAFHHAGRIEQVSDQPTIILDVAHNEASTNALVQTLCDRPDWQTFQDRFLVVAISKDKNREAILNQVLPFFSHVILTRFVTNPRSTSLDDLFETATTIKSTLHLDCELECIDTATEAWESVRVRLGPSDFCCVAGSLFLIAELREQIIEQYSKK